MSGPKAGNAGSAGGERRMRGEVVELERGEAFRAASGLLDGRVVILTGATGGSARRSRGCSSQRARVSPSFRTSGRPGVRTRLGSTVSGAALDVSSLESFGASTRRSRPRSARTDGIVNCAGLGALRTRTFDESMGANHRRQPRHRLRHLPNRPSADGRTGRRLGREFLRRRPASTARSHPPRTTPQPRAESSP
jgi:hypothetical protein